MQWDSSLFEGIYARVPAVQQQAFRTYQNVQTARERFHCLPYSFQTIPEYIFENYYINNFYA
jgi:hypothetical protein